MEEADTEESEEEDLEDEEVVEVVKKPAAKKAKTAEKELTHTIYIYILFQYLRQDPSASCGELPQLAPLSEASCLSIYIYIYM